MAGVGSTDLISITVVSPSPEVAAAAANTFATLYVQQRKDQVSSSFTARADELRQKSAEIDAQIAEIDDQLAERPSRERDHGARGQAHVHSSPSSPTCRARATQFDVEAATRTGNVEIAETATPPTEPFSPPRCATSALAGVLALLIGIGLAFLLDRLDDKIHDPGDVDHVAGGLPTIGVIPIDTPRQEGRPQAPQGLSPVTSCPSTRRRPSRSGALRSNLRFTAVGVKHTSVLLTSSEGCRGQVHRRRQPRRGPRRERPAGRAGVR